MARKREGLAPLLLVCLFVFVSPTWALESYLLERVAFRLAQAASRPTGRTKGPEGEITTLPSQTPEPHHAAPKVVVLIDPEAGYRTGYGFGRGYYYAEDLSRVAKQETEIALEKKGYQVLVSSGDIAPLQEELELENSEWGFYGKGRKSIGYFAGADYIFLVSAHVLREQNFQVGDWRRQAEMLGLKVGVELRQIELETRHQLQTMRGAGSAAAVRRIRLPLGHRWSPFEVEVELAENLGRRAVAEAVEKAVSGLSPISANPSATEWVEPD